MYFHLKNKNITKLVFSFLLYLLIFNNTISATNGDNITKTTIIEMNDDLTFNVLNKYEYTDIYLFDFYTDAFLGFKNTSKIGADYSGGYLIIDEFDQYYYGDKIYEFYHGYGYDIDQTNLTEKQIAIFNFTELNYDITNENWKIINFVTIIPPINSIKNKDINNEYILNYELILKTENDSWFPFIDKSQLDNLRYPTEDSLVLRYRFKLLDQIQFYNIQVYFFKKTIETLDSTTQIIINNDGSFIEIYDGNIQPIRNENGFIEYVAPIDLGNNFNNFLQVEELYYIVNNQKLYPAKYNNLVELDKFASNSNDTFAGYIIDKSNNNKYLISKFTDEGPTESFRFHYALRGFVQETFVTNSKDIFTKNVKFNPRIKLQSPNTLYTFKVEIPDGYYIEENSINNNDLLLPGSKLNGQSAIWQYRLDDLLDLDPFVPFGFSYSKNEKKDALKLLYFNLIFMIIILIFHFSNIFKKKTYEIISSFVIFLTNIFIPIYLGGSEFINIFIYSMAYLPILLIAILFVHHLYKNNKITD